MEKTTVSRTESKGHASGVTGIDLGRIFNLIVSRWIVIVVVLALFVGLGAWIISRRPVTYRAKAVVQVEQEPAKVIVMEEVNPEDFKSAEVVKTMEQILTSRSLFLRVVQSEKLMERTDFMPPKPGGEALKESDLIDALDGMVDAKLRRGTRLIDITVDHTDPILAQRLALALLREFTRGGFEQNLGFSRQASDFLLQEADKLRGKLKQSEEALQQYCESVGTVSLVDKQDIVIAKLKDLNLRVSDAKNARLKLEADMERLNEIAADRPQDILTMSATASLPEVLDLKKQINTADAEMATIKKRYLPEHPKYIHAAGQLRELNESLKRVASEAGELLKSSYAGVRGTEQQLETALREQEAAALQLNKAAIPYNVLLREVESDRTILEAVLKRVKETEIAQGIEKSPIRVVESPQVPTSPQSAKKKILAIAIVLGLAVGVGGVLLFDSFDSSLHTVDQAEQLLGLASLAAIPESKLSRKQRRKLLVESAPDSSEAEAFRSLRASLSFLGEDKTPRSLLFTSSIPAEGKSYCAANCAAAFAQQGLKTVLIDADLRRPTLRQFFTRVKDPCGLCNFLETNVSFEACAHATGHENLFLVPSGPQAKKPPELLAGPRFAELIETALTKFDRVVVDSAPINAVSDPLLLAKHLQSVVLVVRGGKTPARAVLRACRLLFRAGVTPVGILLSRMPSGRAAKYYSYDYSREYAPSSRGDDASVPA